MKISIDKIKHYGVGIAATCSIGAMSLFAMLACTPSLDTETDLLIVGGGASGVSAALQAARMGIDDIIVTEESTWLGGMLTSAGVSAIDGNRRLPAGIFGEFKDSLVSYYGSPESLHTGWVSTTLFEPSRGNEIFKQMLAQEPAIDVRYSTTPTAVQRADDGKWLVSFVNESGKSYTITAKVLIDGTELGDIAAMAGVGYDIGMESRDTTGEDVAPEEPNNIIQDLTMVAILKDYGHDVTIDEPEDYDSDEFACTAINPLCKNPKEPNRQWPADHMMEYGRLPREKYMINWPIEGNDYYVNIIEMSSADRQEAIAEAKEHTMRYIYFLQHELGFNTLGLADDEYPTQDLLPFIPYHRESRRIHGKVRFDLNHIMTPYSTPDPLYRSGIAVGDYPVDHHHQAYSGADELPNLYFHPVPSYSLPLGVIIPDSTDNLLVTEKSISVSNIVNGTTRLQPVVMQIGQAAGAVAAMSLLNGTKTSEVDVRDIQSTILDAGGYLMPYLDVRRDDPNFKAYQRIGASGILKGEGRSVDWNNETWLHVDQPMILKDLDGLAEFTQTNIVINDSDETLTKGHLIEILNIIVDNDLIEDIVNAQLPEKELYAPVTRGEYAIVIDRILNPFERRVDIRGNFIE